MNNQAELISIGNELLSGQTLNTHAKDLGSTLTSIGLQLARDTTIPDDIPIVETAVAEALERSPLVFVSGGLGPTVDDITRDALARLLGCEIILDQPSVTLMAERYAARGRTLTPAAERQAQVLADATVLPNSAGAAPGQRIELAGGKTLFVLPGPPNEFNAILNEEIVPWLKEHCPGIRPKVIRTVLTTGIGESDIVTILEDANFTANGAELGFYPGRGRVRIRISAEAAQEAAVAEVEKELCRLLADFLDPSA